MKKWILLSLITLCFQGIIAQSIFERYSNSTDVSYFSISPKMFEMLGQMSISVNDPEAKEYLETVNSINNFKVLVTSEDAISQDIRTWMDNRVKRQKLEVLMTFNDEGSQNIAFYVKAGSSSNKVAQLLMFASDMNEKSTISISGKSLETVLLLLEGDIDLNQISNLTNKMDLPGGDQLKKAAKNKPL